MLGQGPKMDGEEVWALQKMGKIPQKFEKDVKF
jgi:hypothetical protein